MIRARPLAFSLVEVVVAIGLIAFCGLAILGLMLQGIEQTREIRSETVALLLARQIRTRLLEPAWPRQRQAEGDHWQASLYFDGSGAPLPDSTNAALAAELISGPGLGFLSPRLESVRARVLEQPGGREIDSFVLQRVTEETR